MHLTGDSQCTLTLGGFFCQQVTTSWFPESDFSWSGDLECFFCPGMGFYFWHKKYWTLPLLVPSNRRRTFWTLREYSPHISVKGVQNYRNIFKKTRICSKYPHFTALWLSRYCFQGWNPETPFLDQWSPISIPLAHWALFWHLLHFAKLQRAVF